MKFEELAPHQIQISRTWRDHREQLVALAIFMVVGIIGLVVVYHQRGWIPGYFYVWILLSGIGFLYYIFPTARAAFDLGGNYWVFARYLLFLPHHMVEGKIAEISMIVVVEKNAEFHHSFSENSPRQERGDKMHSSLELWGFPNEEEEREKTVVFSRSTFDIHSHYNELNNLRVLAKKMVEYFQARQLPTEYFFLNESNRD